MHVFIGHWSRGVLSNSPYTKCYFWLTVSDCADDTMTKSNQCMCVQNIPWRRSLYEKDTRPISFFQNASFAIDISMQWCQFCHICRLQRYVGWCWGVGCWISLHTNSASGTKSHKNTIHAIYRCPGLSWILATATMMSLISNKLLCVVSLWKIPIHITIRYELLSVPIGKCKET